MGGLVSTWQMVFPPKAQWSTSQIPELADKIAIVTGGNSGKLSLRARLSFD